MTAQAFHWTWEADRRKRQIAEINVWQREERRSLGSGYEPITHPGDIVDAVLEYVRVFGQPKRMIVWFLQPHTPYVGKNAIRINYGVKRQKPSINPKGVPAYDCADGWEEVRAAYVGNLELVWPYATGLFSKLDGCTILTGDHGEILGEIVREDSRWRGYGYGHFPDWKNEELWHVPWLESRRGGDPSSPISEMLDQPRPDEEEVLSRLHQLGYMF
jgi:hypothetical protein